MAIRKISSLEHKLLTILNGYRNDSPDIVQGSETRTIQEEDQAANDR